MTDSTITKVLGLDISTSKIGYCTTEHIVSEYGYNRKIISELTGVIKVSSIKYPNLLDKAHYVIRELISMFESNGAPDRIQIEDSLTSYAALLSMKGGNFKAKATPQNLKKLSGMNYIVQYALYRYLKQKPYMINVNSARKMVFGTTTIFKGKDTKKVVRDKIVQMFPYIIKNFETKIKGINKDDWTDSSFDICDAAVISLCILNSEDI